MSKHEVTVVHQFDDYRMYLASELTTRCQLNPQYSLRAFARDLTLSPSRLSEILNGKQGLSQKSALRICENLQLSKDEESHFCNLVLAKHGRSSAIRKRAQAEIQKTTPYQTLKDDLFATISDWYHFAILELVQLDTFDLDPQWISQKLGISKIQAKLALERLERLELLKVSEKGTQSNNNFIGGDLPNEAIKKFHQQVLQKATQAIAQQPPKSREFSANIIALDKSEIESIKDELRKTRRRLVSSVENKNPQKNAIYCLGIQFFELTQG